MSHNLINDNCPLNRGIVELQCICTPAKEAEDEHDHTFKQLWPKTIPMCTKCGQYQSPSAPRTGNIAYSPEHILIRPILAKYLIEWKGDMIDELAKLLSTAAKEKEVAVRESIGSGLTRSEAVRYKLHYEQLARAARQDLIAGVRTKMGEKRDMNWRTTTEREADKAEGFNDLHDLITDYLDNEEKK